jgi:hypothetical protein
MSLLVPIVTYQSIDRLGAFGCLSGWFSRTAEFIWLCLSDSAICRGSFGSIEAASATSNHLVIADIAKIKKCKFAMRSTIKIVVEN